MITKRTTRKPYKPVNGPCGGLGIWNILPPRHWCKMTDEEVALFVLAGHPMNKWNKLTKDQQQDAWVTGCIAIPHKTDLDPDGWTSIVLNSRCRWAKKPRTAEAKR